MKIILLGSDGMLAYALKQVLSFEKVYAFNKKELDITNPCKFEEKLNSIFPDICINCAAYTDIEKAESEPNTCELVNGQSVGYLAEACKKRKIWFLHLSSDYVFGNEKVSGYLEEDVPKNPLNKYGQSKLIAEKLIQQSDFYWIVRTSWLFGPNGKNFVNKILKLAEEEEIKVVKNQWGCPTYTFDLARAIYTLIKEKPKKGIYHLVNSEITSRVTFAECILKYSGLKRKIIPTTSEEAISMVKCPTHSVLLNTKKIPLRNWRKGLFEYLVGINKVSSDNCRCSE